MAKTAFQKALDQRAAVYDKDVALLINAAHAKHVVPYCDKKGYTFLSGMGGFSFHDSKGRYVDEDKLPKRLLVVLNADLLYGNNDAGALMPNYRPKNYGK